MGWTIEAQLLRSQPLTTDERLTLRALLHQIDTWPWDCEPFVFELPADRRDDGLIGRAVTKVGYDTDTDGDAQQVLRAVAALLDTIPGATALVDDDLGTIGRDADGGYALNGGQNAATLLDDDGDWALALQPPPTDLPEKLRSAIAVLDAAPSDAPGAEKERAKALKTLGTDANVGKLILALCDERHTDASRDATRAALARVPAETVVRVAIKKRKKLDARGHMLLSAACRALDDVTGTAALFLQLWQKGRGKHHWGDLCTAIPEETLGRLARQPELARQLADDLALALDEQDDEPVCRRAGVAARILGHARTRFAAKTLVGEARRARSRYVGGDYRGETRPLLHEGLGALVVGPLEPEPGLTPPIATLLLCPPDFSKRSRDGAVSVLRALATAAPDEATPLLLRYLDADQWTESVVAAMAELPDGPAEALLRMGLCARDSRTCNSAGRALVARFGPRMLPAVIAKNIARGDERPRAPYTVERHALRVRELPTDQAGWSEWFAANGYLEEGAPSLPPVELLLAAAFHRPYVGRADSWRAALTDAAADPSLRRSVVIGARLFAKEHREPAFDLSAMPGWASLDGLSLQEQLAAVAADASLPPQVEPAWVRSLDAADGSVAEAVAARAEWVVDLPKMLVAQLSEREEAWLAEHG